MNRLSLSSAAIAGALATTPAVADGSVASGYEFDPPLIINDAAPRKFSGSMHIDEGNPIQDLDSVRRCRKGDLDFQTYKIKEGDTSLAQIGVDRLRLEDEAVGDFEKSVRANTAALFNNQEVLDRFGVPSVDKMISLGLFDGLPVYYCARVDKALS